MRPTIDKTAVKLFVYGRGDLELVSQEQLKQTSFGVLRVWRKFTVCFTERILLGSRVFDSLLDILFACFIGRISQ